MADENPSLTNAMYDAVLSQDNKQQQPQKTSWLLMSKVQDDNDKGDSEEQEEEVEAVPEPAKPEKAAKQPVAQAEQQLGQGHLWHPDVNDRAAPQGPYCSSAMLFG